MTEHDKPLTDEQVAALLHSADETQPYSPPAHVQLSVTQALRDLQAERAKNVTQAADIVTLREAMMGWKCLSCHGRGDFGDDTGRPCPDCNGSGLHPRAQAALKATEPE